ncbi:K02A2.6-like [Cordylochernes scorpioides]|uniref:K02A2.6-like n=1 Tax=Cordylochernes scorpioides TaxID=51811 RepID=A0ABY6KTI2_9ARAC|nr:K02A2.6-like [Cordylochernes scorpioides]
MKCFDISNCEIEISNPKMKDGSQAKHSTTPLVRLSKEGNSYSVIVKKLKAEGLDVGKATICRVVNGIGKKREAESNGQKFQVDRPRPVRTPATVSKVKRLATTENPPSQRQLSRMCGTSLKTINNIIHKDLELDTRQKGKVHKLTPFHMKNRATNARKLYEEHLAGSRSEYTATLDEAWMYVTYCNGIRKICYIKRGNQVPDNWVHQCSETFPKGFMVVGVMTGRGVLPLIKVPSKVKVNSEFYIECVLKPVIEQLKDLYPGEMDKVFLHHDKASSHTSNKTQQFLQEMKDTLGLNFIRNSDIPVKSPDASPLDFYGFGMLKQRLFNRRPKTEAGLWKAAQEEWSNVSLSKVKEVNQKIHWLGKFLPEIHSKICKIATPLTNLTQKNKLFSWTPQVDKSFIELKAASTSEPILTTYNPEVPCKLYTDASAIGIAGILSQEIDSTEHVISYYSKKLLKHQQNYSAYELECYAVIQAIDYFEVYLENKPFQVITDHSALQWLLNLKNPKSKFFRWLVNLSTKPFTITHRSGNKLTHVDALSRAPVLSISIFELQHQRQADLSFIEEPQDHQNTVMVKKRGLLRAVVPASFKEHILKEYHDNMRQLIIPDTELQPAQVISADTIVMGASAEKTKHKYIQVFIDHLTIYVWAFSTIKNTAQATLQCFNRILQVNGTIMTKLRAALLDKPKVKWSTLLPKVITDYNNTPHDVTGFPPSFLLFSYNVQPQFADNPSNSVEDARKLAIKITQHHRDISKRRHDSRHSDIEFKVGDLVLKEFPTMIRG